MRIYLSAHILGMLLALTACQRNDPSSAPAPASPAPANPRNFEVVQDEPTPPNPVTPPSNSDMPNFEVVEEPPAPPCPENFKEIPLTAENWVVGWGDKSEITFDSSDKSILLKPAPSFSSSETHSALVLSKSDYENFSALVTYVNVGSTRTKAKNNPPKVWEVFWLLFNLTFDAQGDKQANYFIAKPNGSEFGRMWGKKDQNFASTSMLASAGYGEQITLTIHRNSDILTGNTGGIFNSRFVPTTKNWFYNNPGKIGLYSEDAEVRIKKFCIGPPKGYNK